MEKDKKIKVDKDAVIQGMPKPPNYEAEIKKPKKPNKPKKVKKPKKTKNIFEAFGWRSKKDPNRSINETTKKSMLK